MNCHLYLVKKYRPRPAGIPRLRMFFHCNLAEEGRADGLEKNSVKAFKP